MHCTQLCACLLPEMLKCSVYVRHQLMQVPSEVPTRHSHSTEQRHWTFVFVIPCRGYIGFDILQFYEKCKGTISLKILLFQISSRLSIFAKISIILLNFILIRVLNCQHFKSSFYRQYSLYSLLTFSPVSFYIWVSIMASWSEWGSDGVDGLVSIVTEATCTHVPTTTQNKLLTIYA